LKELASKVNGGNEKFTENEFRVLLNKQKGTAKFINREKAQGYNFPDDDE
jgi:hypothetical protein